MISETHINKLRSETSKGRILWISGNSNGLDRSVIGRVEGSSIEWLLSKKKFGRGWGVSIQYFLSVRKKGGSWIRFQGKVPEDKGFSAQFLPQGGYLLGEDSLDLAWKELWKLALDSVSKNSKETIEEALAFLESCCPPEQMEIT